MQARKVKPPTPPLWDTPIRRRVGLRLTAHPPRDRSPRKSQRLSNADDPTRALSFAFKGASAFSRAEQVPPNPLFQVTPPSRHCLQNPTVHPAAPAGTSGGPRLGGWGEGGVKSPPVAAVRPEHRRPGWPHGLRRAEAEECAPFSVLWGERIAGVRSAPGATLQRWERGGVPGRPQVPAASCGSAAFAAQHCPLVSAVETDRLRGAGSFSSAAGTDLFSPPGHNHPPALVCPQEASKEPSRQLKALQLPLQALSHPQRDPGSRCLNQATCMAHTPC